MAKVKITRTKTRTKKVPSGYQKCRNCGGDGITRIKGKSGSKKKK